MTLRAELEQTLAAGARRGLRGDVTAIRGREVITEINAGRPDAVRELSGLSACLRARVGGRVGSVSTTSLQHPDQLWDQAQALAGCGPPDPDPGPVAQAPGPVPSPARDRAPDQDPGLDLVTLQDRTGLRVHGTQRESTHDVAQAEVGGPVRTQVENLVQVELVLEGGTGGDYDLTWNQWSHRRRPGAAAGLEPAAVDWLEWAARWQDQPVRSAPTGLMTMVLTPSAVHAALAPLVASLDGTEILAGRSAVPSDRAGTDPILHPALELWDGGGAATVDDEGTATAPLRLVAGGRPESAYHSRHTASVLRAAPTGHARRGTPLRRELERPVRPVLTDVRVELASTGGPVRQGSWSDLIAGVRRGIVVDSLLGAGQARQGGAAQHRLEGRVRLGWVVEAGRVVGRLEPVSVSVPLVEVLVTRLRAVSSETWPVGRAWTGRLPFLVVSGVRFR